MTFFLHKSDTSIALPNIGAMLKANSTLVKLSLLGNKIKGVHDLCIGLKSSKALGGLDLSDNRIADSDVHELLDAVAENKSLKYLDVRNCAFGPIDAEKLAAMKEKQPFLTLLLQDSAGDGKDTYCHWTRHSVILRDSDVKSLAEKLVAQPPTVV